MNLELNERETIRLAVATAVTCSFMHSAGAPTREDIIREVVDALEDILVFHTPKGDYGAMLENLTAVQARCTELLEENRALKVKAGESGHLRMIHDWLESGEVNEHISDRVPHLTKEQRESLAQAILREEHTWT